MSNPAAAAAAMSNEGLAAGGSGMERVGCKKDFTHMERVDGRMVNVLQGLELHTGVFSPAEQQRIVDCVHHLQDEGRRGRLRERSYSEPRKWMRGKGSATIQFGCCYNYASDRHGNPSGIIRGEEVDPLTPLLKSMVRRLVEWRVLPPSCVPDSCIVNIYDVGDCIPPHIDHHDFARPFCTVSFLAECSILFGRDLRVLGPGEFAVSASIALPVGSVLVLKGNGADVSKHCVPAVPAKRISITFRKMDQAKLPFNFRPDPDLQNLVPLPLQLPPHPFAHPAAAPARAPVRPAVTSPPISEQQQQQATSAVRQAARAGQMGESGGAFSLSSDDFPALGASPATATATRGSKGRR